MESPAPYDVRPDSTRESSTPETPTKSSRFWHRANAVAGPVWKAGLLLTVLIGLIAGIGFAQRRGWLTAGGGSAAELSADAGQRYICPMRCTPPSDQPGRCPVCGMKLVELSGDSAGDGRSVVVEPVARRILGIRTVETQVGSIEQTIRSVGRIDYDDSKRATIAAYVDGRIEELFANYVGVRVRQGDALALLYSPDLYTAQVEYLTALEQRGNTRFDGLPDLTETARKNLIELGLSEIQVDQMRSRGTAESRLRIESPITGTVIEKPVTQGDYVRTGETMFEVADLSTVWLMLDLYPDDAARIRFGQKVEARTSGGRERTWNGRVAFIHPTVDQRTRTVRVRVEILNEDRQLRPGDFATAQIRVPAVEQDKLYDPALAGKYISPMHPQVIREQPGDCPICGMDLIPTSEMGFTRQPLPEPDVLTVPRDAVLMVGEASVVYVEAEPGRFETRRVVLGPITEDRAVIREGLLPGERVAREGNFLIDSQMQLAGNPSLLDPGKAALYPEGPLPLFPQDVTVLAGPPGTAFDNVVNAYLPIQRALAADQVPSPDLTDRLAKTIQILLQEAELPQAAEMQIRRAATTIEQLSPPIESSRKAFRRLSHALLRAATLVRGPATADSLVHMYCPMVPGGGGDWIQRGGELINPYWGAEMLHCGETVGSFDVSEEAPQQEGAPR